MARMSLPTPTLRTARLSLRPFTSAEADALSALAGSGQLRTVAYKPGDVGGHPR